MNNSLEDLLSEHKPRHSDYQMDNFVTVKSGGTLWGMLQQARTEVFGRYESFRIDFFAALELSDKIEFFKGAVNPGLPGMFDDDDLHGASALVDGERISKATIFRLQAELDSATKGLRMKLEEIIRYFAQYKALKSAVGNLSEQEEKDEEIRKWIFHFRKQAAKDLMSMQAISGEIYECLLALGSDIMSRILGEIQAVMEKDPSTLVTFLCAEDKLPSLSGFLTEAKGEIHSMIRSEYGAESLGLALLGSPETMLMT